MDASDITKNKRLNIAVSSYKYGIGKTAIARAQGNPASNNSIKTALAITKQDKGTPAVSAVPTITFVSYTSPNATLAYTTGGKTITEYGFIVGTTKFPITNSSRVLKLTDHLFPSGGLSTTFNVHAYLTYDGVDIISDSRSITLAITFGTLTIDSNGIARFNYGGDYPDAQVGIFSEIDEVYHSVAPVNRVVSLDIFLRFGQNNTDIRPYAMIDSIEYAPLQNSLSYDWNNYLIFGSLTVDGTMTLNYTAPATVTLNTISVFESNRPTPNAGAAPRVTFNQGNTVSLQPFFTVGVLNQQDTYTLDTFSLSRGGFTSTFVPTSPIISPSYNPYSQLGFQLNINPNGFVSYSILSGFSLDQGPVLSGDHDLEGETVTNRTIGTTPEDKITPYAGQKQFLVTATVPFGSVVLTATAPYNFETYLDARINIVGDTVEILYNGNLGDYVTSGEIIFVDPSSITTAVTGISTSKILVPPSTQYEVKGIINSRFSPPTEVGGGIYYMTPDPPPPQE